MNAATKAMIEYIQDHPEDEGKSLIDETSNNRGEYDAVAMEHYLKGWRDNLLDVGERQTTEIWGMLLEAAFEEINWVEVYEAVKGANK